MKTTTLRVKKRTYSMDDKDGKDPRVCGAGAGQEDRDGPTSCGTRRNKWWIGGGKGKFIEGGNSFLLGHSYNLL